MVTGVERNLAKWVEAECCTTSVLALRCFQPSTRNGQRWLLISLPVGLASIDNFGLRVLEISFLYAIKASKSNLTWLSRALRQTQMNCLVLFRREYLRSYIRRLIPARRYSLRLSEVKEPFLRAAVLDTFSRFLN